MKTKSILIAPLLCLLAAGAHAEPVYRCGSAYSQTPCPQGGQVVEASDPRTASQRAEARRSVADEKRLAAEMRRDRLADEKALRPAGATSLGGAKAPEKAASAPASRHKKPKRHTTTAAPRDDFVAIDPSTRRRRSSPAP